ncbi:MAG: glycosyltransferase family 2 protein [Candidatus Aenigmarchaeota archaeon]|nr:glycosyltransferase family 2 protein [Candidatus Aenigmarchaeota archaeon]
MNLVSVIIPTYNNERTLGECIDSIKKQTYVDIEIIIVDNNSNDNTQAIAKKMGAKVIQLNAERTTSKNFGAEKAKGRYVCFIDSDMILTSNVIKESVLIAGKENVGGIVIPEMSTGNSFWTKVRNFERSFYKNTIVESARFFRRDLILKSGGFDENLVCYEESTLPQKIEKLGFSINARTEAEILHNENDFSIMKWLNRKFYYGKSVWEYGSNYKEYGSKQIGFLYRSRLFFNNKRFYSNPVLMAGVIVLKTLEYISAFFGHLIKK